MQRIELQFVLEITQVEQYGLCTAVQGYFTTHKRTVISGTEIRPRTLCHITVRNITGKYYPFTGYFGP